MRTLSIMRRMFKALCAILVACTYLPAAAQNAISDVMDLDQFMPLIKVVAEQCPDEVLINPKLAKEFQRRIQSPGFNRAEYEEMRQKGLQNQKESCRKLAEKISDTPTPLNSRYLLWAPKLKAAETAAGQQGVPDGIFVPGNCLVHKIVLGKDVETWNICFVDASQATFKVTPSSYTGPTKMLPWSQPGINKLIVDNYRCATRIHPDGRVQLTGCDIAATYDVVRSN